MKLPEWFVESLVDEQTKTLAKTGKLKGTTPVLVRCSCCKKEYDVIINSCVKTRNKNDKNHKLCCRSCSLTKSDIYNGRVFGNLTVIDSSINDGKILCKCVCGKTVSVFINNLRSGRTSSCGKHKHYDVKQSLYNKCMNLFECFLKRIDSKYDKLAFSKLFNCTIDFVISTNNKVVFVKFYGEQTVNSNYPKPEDLFLMSKNNRFINIFVNDYLNNYDKLNHVFYDIIYETKKINARQCVVKEVPFIEASTFYNTNHIQGSTYASRINYGLYYNNDLYAVMGFGSSNYHSMKNMFCNEHFDSSRYELHRYAVKLGYSIVGGCSKLLKHFEREYSPSYLLSYSSNDWFTGNMYQKLGFCFSCYSPPRYFWVKDEVVLSREKCQIKRLQKEYPDLVCEAFKTNAKNKEVFVMKKLGFSKVLTSGTKKWEKFY